MKNYKNEKCPVRKALMVLGGKWSMLIIMHLSSPKRYGELKKQLPDISEKMLIQSLRLLESAKIITRKDYHQIPPKVLYSLSKTGKKVLKIIPLLENIGKKIPK